MPHIFVDGEDNERSIQSISLHARITAKKDYHRTPKYYAKIEELKKEMQQLISKYFDDYDSCDYYENADYNKIHQ